MSNCLKKATVIYMSKKFNKVKRFYDEGFWTIEMVKNSVVKDWITEAEFKEITGEDYE